MVTLHPTNPNIRAVRRSFNLAFNQMKFILTSAFPPLLQASLRHFVFQFSFIIIHLIICEILHSTEHSFNFFNKNTKKSPGKQTTTKANQFVRISSGKKNGIRSQIQPEIVCANRNQIDAPLRTLPRPLSEQ